VKAARLSFPRANAQATCCARDLSPKWGTLDFQKPYRGSAKTHLGVSKWGHAPSQAIATSYAGQHAEIRACSRRRPVLSPRQSGQLPESRVLAAYRHLRVEKTRLPLFPLLRSR
jgi:hypothetical protein